MPYNPSTGVYNLPAIYLAIPGTTIIAQQHNDPLVDLQSANNYPRPIIAGGTGAINAAGARTNLEVAAADETVTFISPSVDNVVPRWDGVDGAVQDSALTIDDDGNATLVSTDDGSAAGPVADLHRDSASPAANDIIGSRQWTGEDDGGNKTIYAEQRGVILDPADTTEDGKLVTRTVVAGALADRLHIGAGVWTEGAVGGDPGVGKANFTEVQRDGDGIQPLITRTPQATTTGTAFAYTSIPSWVKRITVLFVGVGLSGNEDVLVQIGDSGGLATTGYTSASNSATSTSGFIVNLSNSSGVLSGALTIIHVGSNVWVSSHSVYGNANGRAGGGDKTLSGTLDRLTITRTGSNTFDAGSVNIQYE